MTSKYKEFDIDMSMSLVKRAKKLATILHEGQKRKYTDDDYIAHPQEVAKTLELHGKCEETVAAGWLHDVVEDQYFEGIFDVIEYFTNPRVVSLVLWVTDVAQKEHGNRFVRKKLNNAALSCAPIEAKDIKLCDMISNMSDVAEKDPKFARVYLPEKARTISAAMNDADPVLVQKAWDIITGMVR